MDFLELELEENDVPYSILAVEDDLPSLQALTNILHLANFHVRGVSSGKKALKILENGAPFELVILDVMMPELSGYEVLETLREKYSRLELPVLMLTSKSQSEGISLCFKLGANDYLTKPFEVGRTPGKGTQPGPAEKSGQQADQYGNVVPAGTDQASFHTECAECHLLPQHQGSVQGKVSDPGSFGLSEGKL